MKKITFLIFIFCYTTISINWAQVSIIPMPNKVTIKEGIFIFAAKDKITLPKDSDWQRVGNDFIKQINVTTGFSLSTGVKGRIKVNKVQDQTLEKEGYRINADSNSIVIEAQTAQGFFYAIQSIYQLLPVEVFGNSKANITQWSIPLVNIEDVPRFQHRGLHLDVSRHFFDIDFVKKYIDLIALHKQNTFHWHLTDDQGWRIEIQKYPKLTEVGAYRKESDGRIYGGYYTQQEIKEIVKYAADRFVNVIPEIELPGHASAAIAAYPELGNTPNQKITVPTTWGIFHHTFNPKDSTFLFLQDVLTEVMAIFPSKYIHIGGDECRKTQWQKSDFAKQLIVDKGLKNYEELQSYFIKRIDSFVNSKGRIIIGWDEILEGGLSPNATVMSWRGVGGAVSSAKMGHDVIMSPNSHCYLDYYQHDIKAEIPKSYPRLITLQTTYSYEPIPNGLSTEQEKHILGVQGNAWTEYMQTKEKVEYSVFPRGIALAEVGWTQKEYKDFADFSARWEHHKKRLDILNVNYFGSSNNDKYDYTVK